VRELGPARIEAHGTPGTMPRGASVNYAKPSHVTRILAGQSGTCANKSKNPGDAHRLLCTNRIPIQECATCCFQIPR
jgi:hypothetical protein